MKLQQINKKQPYYGTGNKEITMPPEQTMQKAKNEKFLKALIQIYAISLDLQEINQAYLLMIESSLFNLLQLCL